MSSVAFSQSFFFFEGRFLSETKKLANAFGKPSDPFPYYGNGLGLQAGYAFPAAAGLVALKSGLVEFRSLSAQLDSGDYRLQTAMIPVEFQYYAPSFIRGGKVQIGLMGTAGFYRISTLSKPLLTSSYQKQKSNRFGWALAIYFSYSRKALFPHYQPFYMINFGKIAGRNFVSAQIDFPIRMKD